MLFVQNRVLPVRVARSGVERVHLLLTNRTDSVQTEILLEANLGRAVKFARSIMGLEQFASALCLASFIMQLECRLAYIIDR